MRAQAPARGRVVQLFAAAAVLMAVTMGTPVAAVAEPAATPTAPPALTADEPPAAAEVGARFSYRFAASGAPTPAFSVLRGALPVGLELSADGLLSGTPTEPGTSEFAIAASNSTGVAISVHAITVRAVPAVPVEPVPAEPVLEAPEPPVDARPLAGGALLVLLGSTGLVAYRVRRRA